jgi:putative glutamine amidotransferase
MKKRIGVSYTWTFFDNYWNWFTKEDLQDDLELVKLSFEENNIKDIHTCDGFLLTGGVDIHPSYYGGPLSYENIQKLQPERDKFEKEIFDYSQKMSFPVLGICRGMQLINVLQGGKLIQDIGDANVVHRTLKNTPDKEHIVDVESNTLLHEISMVHDGQVNSSHHQAVDPKNIGDNLLINAYSATGDGIIEGIEFKNKEAKAFMLGVQWHPERMRNNEHSLLSKRIKDRFIAAVKEL